MEIVESLPARPTSATPRPYAKSMSQIKASLLEPALTSHYQCWFNPPQFVRNWSKAKGFDYDALKNDEFISLSCCEASLPGSSFMTNEIANDYTGVTERHAYRRQYDDRSDFTFYVDRGRPDGNYGVLLFFENWMSYIAGESFSLGLEKEEYFYRVTYPKYYKSSAIYLNKFERDYDGTYLKYRFLQAYPISISSMPVSYDSSQLLKCTVSFTYTRYVINREILFTRPVVNAAQTGPDQMTVDVLNPDGSLTTIKMSLSEYNSNYAPSGSQATPMEPPSSSSVQATATTRWVYPTTTSGQGTVGPPF